MKNTFSGLCAALALSTLPAAHAEDAQGQWSGLVAGTVPVVVTISKDAGGVWSAVILSPSQGNVTLAVDSVNATADHLSLRLGRVNASYEASWNAANSSWVGTWTQGPSMPLALKRIDPQGVQALQPKRPQEAAIAASVPPYAASEVHFANTGAGIELAGTLTLPQGKGPFPAVVLVHGSGPNLRDEEIFGHKLFLVLADHLSRQGIAVLRYDKRGLGASSGNYQGATTFDFAADAAAAVNYLRTRPDIKLHQIGMIGHSEGGLIAPLAAARDPQLAFIVMMAGPGVRGDLLLTEQIALIAKAVGTSEVQIAATRALNRQLFGAISTSATPEQGAQRAKAILDKAQADGALSAADAAAQLARFSSAWFHTLLSYDPAPTLERVRQPVLALNGERDLQVPAKMDLDALRLALRHNPRAQVMELPGLNHVFQTARTGAPTEYGVIEETLAPLALSTISDWIHAQTR